MSDGVAATTRLMDLETKVWLLAAAQRARHRYPGAVGELLSQELQSWLVFGQLLGSDLILRVADQILCEDRDLASSAGGAMTGVDVP